MFFKKSKFNIAALCLATCFISSQSSANKLLLNIAGAAIGAPGLGSDLSKMQKQYEKRLSQCRKTFGSVSIVEPDDLSPWRDMGLSLPTRILKVSVNDSKCFTLVDRGAGLAASQLERSLAASGQLQQGQNIGGGQLRAADFVLVPDLISQNANAGGSKAGIKGSSVMGFGGGASRNTQKKSAEVVLSLVDVRTSEQVFSVSANAEISDKAWNAFIGGSSHGVQGEAGVGAWTNTEIGLVVKNAYQNAFEQMIQAINKGKIINNRPAAPIATPEPVMASAPVVAPSYNTAPSYNEVAESNFAPVSNSVNIENTANTSTQVTNTVVAAPTAANIQLYANQRHIAITRIARLFQEADPSSATVTQLKPEMIIYPTGEFQGSMLKVKDEMGNAGWVPLFVVQ